MRAFRRLLVAVTILSALTVLALQRRSLQSTSIATIPVTTITRPQIDLTEDARQWVKALGPDVAGTRPLDATAQHVVKWSEVPVADAAEAAAELSETTTSSKGSELSDKTELQEKSAEEGARQEVKESEVKVEERREAAAAETVEESPRRRPEGWYQLAEEDKIMDVFDPATELAAAFRRSATGEETYEVVVCVACASSGCVSKSVEVANGLYDAPKKNTRVRVELWIRKADMQHPDVVSVKGFVGATPEPVIDGSLATAEAALRATRTFSSARLVVAIDASAWRVTNANDWALFTTPWEVGDAGLAPWWHDAHGADDAVPWWLSDLGLIFCGPRSAQWLSLVVDFLRVERPRFFADRDQPKRELLLRVCASVAAREAWWRLEKNRTSVRLAPLESSFLRRLRLDRRDDVLPDDTSFANGPVGRYFADAHASSLRKPRTWGIATDAIFEAARSATPPDQKQQQKHQPEVKNVVVVTGADSRYAGGKPAKLDRLPNHRLTAEEHDAVVVELGRDKLRWAKAHGYGFEFVVTNSIGPALRACGLRHWEFAKAFALIAAAHAATTRGRAANGDDVWLLWLDHDVWVNPNERWRSLDDSVAAVPRGASLVLSNFRSLNTGIVLVKLDDVGRSLLFEWLVAVIAGRVECQPYDQAALQYVLFSRLAGQEIDATADPFGYSCRRPACGGTPDKPFGMCNPHFHAALDKGGALAPDLPGRVCWLSSSPRSARPPGLLSWCGDAVDRGHANPVLNRVGFHVLAPGPRRPRLQCFQPRAFEACQTNPGANFGPANDDEHPGWLFAHKSMDIFMANVSYDDRAVPAAARRPPAASDGLLAAVDKDDR